MFAGRGFFATDFLAGVDVAAAGFAEDFAGDGRFAGDLTLSALLATTFFGVGFLDAGLPATVFFAAGFLAAGLISFTNFSATFLIVLFGGDFAAFAEDVRAGDLCAEPPLPTDFPPAACLEAPAVLRGVAAFAVFFGAGFAGERLVTGADFFAVDFFVAGFAAARVGAAFAAPPLDAAGFRDASFLGVALRAADLDDLAVFLAATGTPP